MKYIIVIVFFLCFASASVGYGETYESIFTETSEENEKVYSGVDRLAADSGLHSAMIKLLLQQLAELKAEVAELRDRYNSIIIDIDSLTKAKSVNIELFLVCPRCKKELKPDKDNVLQCGCQ